MKKTCILIGLGGHARVIYEAILLSHDYECLGYTDTSAQTGFIAPLNYLGTDSEIIHHKLHRDFFFVNGVGGLRDTQQRKAVFEFYKMNGAKFATIIHPNSVISRFAQLAESVQVLANAVVQASVEVNQNTVINTSAVVEHDCKIGRHCHIAPAAVLGGGVTLGNEVFIGTGAIVLPGIHIVDRTTVGAGAVVTKDILESQVVVGNPAKGVNREVVL